MSELRPRWKRAIDLVDGSLGELVGQDYIARHFPAASKAKMEVLVANLKTAMAGRIARQRLDERADQGGGARKSSTGWT